MDNVGKIAAALATAQAEMTGAAKTSTNPHFKSKYADLESVRAACLPALNKAGIAVVQPVVFGVEQLIVRTILINGESGESLSCDVPILLGKRDMQGLGSAITYARRYGLMCMAGIAPEDDDGNAAVAAGPTKEAASVTPEQYVILRDLIEETGTDEAKFHLAHGHPNPATADLRRFPAHLFEKARDQLERKKASVVADSAKVAAE